MLCAVPGSYVSTRHATGAERGQHLVVAHARAPTVSTIAPTTNGITDVPQVRTHHQTSLCTTFPPTTVITDRTFLISSSGTVK